MNYSGILGFLGLAKGGKPWFSYYLRLIFNCFSQIIKALHNVLFSLRMPLEDNQRASTGKEEAEAQSGPAHCSGPRSAQGPESLTGTRTLLQAAAASVIKTQVGLCLPKAFSFHHWEVLFPNTWKPGDENNLLNFFFT